MAADTGLLSGLHPEWCPVDGNRLVLLGFLQSKPSMGNFLHCPVCDSGFIHQNGTMLGQFTKRDEKRPRVRLRDEVAAVHREFGPEFLDHVQKFKEERAKDKPDRFRPEFCLNDGSSVEDEGNPKVIRESDYEGRKLGAMWCSGCGSNWAFLYDSFYGWHPVVRIGGGASEEGDALCRCTNPRDVVGLLRSMK